MSKAADRPKDNVGFLLACITHSANGKPDFEAVANELKIVSKGAAAKRFARLVKTYMDSKAAEQGGSGGGANNDDDDEAPKAAAAKKRKTTKAPAAKAAKKVKAAAAPRKKKTKVEVKDEDGDEKMAESDSSLSSMSQFDLKERRALREKKLNYKKESEDEEDEEY